MGVDGARENGHRHTGGGPIFPAWRTIVMEALQAAHAAVRRLTPRAGRRVVAGRAAGYRPWDPETIAVDTLTEQAVVATLRRHGVRGTLLSEEAGALPIGSRRGQRTPLRDPVYVVLDPFDGSMLYRRGIRAQWFTALGIYGKDGKARAAGVMDHLTEEITLADRSGAASLSAAHAAPLPLRPSRTTRLTDAFLEAYLMKPEFLYPTVIGLRPVLAAAKFIFPNGGPAGFADVAAGRIDVYLSWKFPLTEVFAGLHIAERAGCLVSQWDGSPVVFRPDIHAVYSLVCSANPRLHKAVLQVLRTDHGLRGARSRVPRALRGEMEPAQPAD